MSEEGARQRGRPASHRVRTGKDSNDAAFDELRSGLRLAGRGRKELADDQEERAHEEQQERLLERAESSASVTSLYKIAHALKIRLPELFARV